MATGLVIFIAAVTMLAGYVLGWSLELRRTNKRIHAMYNLPKESEDFEDIEKTAGLLQRFIGYHRYVKDNFGHYHCNLELDKQLTRDERLLYLPEPSHYTIALVGLCHALGLEVVIREKATGEERAY